MHLDMYLQCNKSGKCLNIGTGDCNQLLCQEKKYGHEITVAFKNFRFSSLLFELRLLLSVTKEEDTKKHLLLYEHLNKCTCTQRAFTNPVHHYNDGKLLNDFPSQNHRMIGVGRDLCGSFSPTAPAEAVSPTVGCTGPCPGGSCTSPEK